MVRLALPRQGALAGAARLGVPACICHLLPGAAQFPLAHCLPTVPPYSPAHTHSPPCVALLPQVLKDIPLYVVTEEKIGLLGTREQAIRIAEELRADTTIAT